MFFFFLDLSCRRWNSTCKIEFFIEVYFSFLTLSQTTNFGLFQTERFCRLQFQVRSKWQNIFQMGKKQRGKRRNCSLWAISPFPTVFSKDFYHRYVKTRACLGKGLINALIVQFNFHHKCLAFNIFSLACQFLRKYLAFTNPQKTWITPFLCQMAKFHTEPNSNKMQVTIKMLLTSIFSFLHNIFKRSSLLW